MWQILIETVFYILRVLWQLFSRDQIPYCNIKSKKMKKAGVHPELTMALPVSHKWQGEGERKRCELTQQSWTEEMEISEISEM